MRKTNLISTYTISIFAFFFAFFVLSTYANAEMEAGGAVEKLGRGFVNTVTGWVEIPKRIYETSEQSGAGAGFTWGLLRGLGYGFVRTTAGLYELMTFPFPAPENYLPVINPEFVFSE